MLPLQYSEKAIAGRLSITGVVSFQTLVMEMMALLSDHVLSLVFPL